MEAIKELSDDDALTLLYDWTLWAREKQLPPLGSWFGWLVLAGRGFGKTRTGAEFIRWREANGVGRRMGLIARTAADARDVMVEGESGLLAVCPPWQMPKYEPSKRRLTWPSGSIATTYSSDKPDQLRGPQHDTLWMDEMASWRRTEAYDQAMFGLRLGNDPRWCGTTTPRATKFVKGIIADPSVITVTGATDENQANLAPTFIQQMNRKYAGTRLGLQEMQAKILDDTPGALWRMGQLDALRVVGISKEKLFKVVVAIDPAVTSEEGADETGIIVAGVAGEADGRIHGYVMDDYSLKGSPAKWARVAIDAYHTYQADRIVAEVNNGGEMVEQTLRSVLKAGETMPAYKKVYASRGKLTRAEPISAFYEEGRVHHVSSFPELEDQMTTWVPGNKSPDRMDALVWAFTHLLVDGDKSAGVTQTRAVGLYSGRGTKRR